MSLVLTPAETDEARRLIARLSELLGPREADLAASPPSPAAPVNKATPLDADFAEAAARLACDVATIRAVYEVESHGQGFGPDGRPIILFEPHVFSRLTKGRYDKTHGGVSYPNWGQKPYKKTQAERWDQLVYAAGLDRDAAYQSASYGAPQIMGFNHRVCGFTDVHAFVAAMSRSARDQLMAFVQFVSGSGLADELRDRRWADFARGYNGPAYAQHGYHTKLAAAYARWSA